MSYWNYRVVETKNKGLNGIEDVYYSIREVYYNDNDEIVMVSQNPVSVYGESLEEIKYVLEQIVKACQYEVIDESKVNPKQWDGDFDRCV